MPEYFLDTFRHPYLRFEKPFTWPSIHLIEPTLEEQGRVGDLLNDRFPDFGEDFCSWQNDPFSGNQKYMTFIAAPKALREHGLVFELRVLVGYAGGALPGEIGAQPEQDRSPEFQTDRIYFKAHLFPIDDIKIEDGVVQQVDVRTFQEVLEASRYSLSHEQRSIWATALFDSIDYGYLHDRLRLALSRLGEWTAGSLYPPITIERMTFCLSLLDFKTGLSMAPPFRELLDHIEEDDWSGLESSREWSKFNSSLHLERTISRGGNPHWHFVPNSETQSVA